MCGGVQTHFLKKGQMLPSSGGYLICSYVCFTGLAPMASMMDLLLAVETVMITTLVRTKIFTWENRKTRKVFHVKRCGKVKKKTDWWKNTTNSPGEHQLPIRKKFSLKKKRKEK